MTLLLVLVALLAYANGSNDNSKGVATLVGYGAASVRQALLFATLATAAGALVSFWFSKGLLKQFSTGLFAGGTQLDQSFFIAVLIGAFGWVIFATVTGLPVSTTHAILGALLGAGLVATGKGRILWPVLNRSFVLPLILSPILACTLVYLLAWPIIWAVARRRRADRPVEAIAVSADSSVAFSNSRGLLDETIEPHREESRIANALHWASGGLISFARGWNDTPKIAALGLLALPQHTGAAFGIVAAAMAAGGLISGRKVLKTLASKLTPLPLPESLTASLTTAALVALACWRGLPVSTTHVATGSIIGAGLKNNPARVRWNKVVEIILSWVITLPAAALIAAAAKWLMR